MEGDPRQRRRRRAAGATAAARAMALAAAAMAVSCSANALPAMAGAKKRAPAAFCYSGGLLGRSRRLHQQQQAPQPPSSAAAAAAAAAAAGGEQGRSSALSRLLLFRPHGKRDDGRAAGRLPPALSLYKANEETDAAIALPSPIPAEAAAASPPLPQQAPPPAATNQQRREYVDVRELSHPLQDRSFRASVAHFATRFREAATGANGKRRREEQQQREEEEEEHDYAARHETEGARPQAWRRLRAMCIPEWPLLVISAIAMLAAASVEVFVPHVSSQALSAVLLGKGKAEFVTHVTRVIQLGLLAAATTGVRGLCFGLAGTRIVCRLRHELFKSLLRQEVAFFDQNQTGELTNRLTADCAKISSVISLNINIMARQTIQLLGGMLFLFRINRLIALAAGGGLGLLFLIAGVHGRFNRAMGEKIQDALAASNVAAGTSLSLIRLVRTHVGESVELAGYDKELRRTVDEMAASDVGYGCFRLLNRVTQTALLGTVLALGFHLTHTGQMKMEELTAALFYVNFVMGASYDVGDQWARIQDALGSATTVFALLDRRPKMEVKPPVVLPGGAGVVLGQQRQGQQQGRGQGQGEEGVGVLLGGQPQQGRGLGEGEGAVSSFSSSGRQRQEQEQQLPPQHLLERPSSLSMEGEGTLLASSSSTSSMGAEIIFENVSFAYPMRKHKPILHNLDLRIAPGHRVAIVGASGGGKSTLLRLLTRLYDPDDTEHGAIFLDGRDIASLSQEELTSEVAMLSQEPPLLPISIRDNIAYGLPPGSYSMGDVIAAARAANAHSFISALPDGYDTMVGEGSVGLSGGEKQRVSIARALIRKPRVLLLDEPTSALDAQSEGLVQRALDQVGKGRTVLIVAHRLSTIEACDSIIVLQNGAVVERGSHAELMARNGVYAALRQQHLTGAAPCP